MSAILRDLSPAQLQATMEDNMAAWVPQFGRLGQWFDDRPPGVKRSITDVPYALFNCIVAARLAPGEVDAVVQAVITDARRHNVPVLWWIAPNTQPDDLGSRLERLGFILDADAPGMAVDLNQVNENLPLVSGLTIERAADEISRRRWSRTLALGFEAPPSRHNFFEEHWSCLLERAGPQAVLAYTGLLEGRAVATSLLFLGGGVAGIYSVSTVPEARRKGIGAWMTLHPLLHARSLGYRVGILQASPMGENLYRSLGFEEYCRVRSYLWAPPVSLTEGPP